MSANRTSNSTLDIYLRKLLFYVAKNPGEFVSYGRFYETTVFLWVCGAFFQIYLNKIRNYAIPIMYKYVYVCLPFIVFLILSPLMLICGYLSWKLIQMMEQEKKEQKRKGILICGVFFIKIFSSVLGL